MSLLLDKRYLPKLTSFASSNVLVAFDFDGTLAPIVPKPSRARMRARTRRLLDAVARRYPCVVISGRALNDIEERVEGIPLWHVAGNHGMEPWEQTEAIARAVRQWLWLLTKRFAPYPRHRHRKQDLLADDSLPPRAGAATRACARSPRRCAICPGCS